MDLKLKDRSVFVTGSSSGVGRATAIAFGAEGARVAVTYHQNQTGAEETAQTVRQAGGQALVLRYDLSDPETIRASVAQIQKEWGELNLLVNNAAPMESAAPTQQPFEAVPQEQWRSMLHNALEGVIWTIQSALPIMRASAWGRIVNVSSTTATDGWPGLGAYGAVKAGLHGLTKTLALELGPANILCNVVSLGAVMTERNVQQIPAEQREQIRLHTPARWLVTPEDVASVIVFLSSQVNRSITGEIIRVTGGL